MYILPHNANKDGIRDIYHEVVDLVHAVMHRCSRIEDGQDVIKEELENELEGYRKHLGTYKDKDWEFLRFKEIFYQQDGFSRSMGLENIGWVWCIVEGEIADYMDNNPWSPDGFSAMHIPFCITYLYCEAWGERIFKDIGINGVDN